MTNSRPLTLEEKRALLNKALLEKRVAARNRAVSAAISQLAEPVGPLSFAQERLWFVHRMESGGAYNLSFALRYQGELHVDVLERALAALAKRQRSLQTRFREEPDGRAVQVLSPELLVPIEQVDLRSVAGDQQQAALESLLRKDAAAPFDLERGPLARVLLVALAPREHALQFTLHHIITDGGSTDIFLAELTELYAAELDGRVPNLAPLPIQYVDFADWQRKTLDAERQAKQLEYWKRQLHGLPNDLSLPTDFPRPPEQGYAGAEEGPLELSSEVARKLRAICEREGVTPFMLAEAVFHAALHRFSGQTDIAVGTPVSGRQSSETEPLIGFFVNLLVLRVSLDPFLSFRALLAQVKEAALGAYANQDVPFEHLVERLNPPRDASRTPFFQAFFVYDRDSEGPSATMGGLRIEPIPLKRSTVVFDLILQGNEVGDALSFSLHYRSDLFSQETASRFLKAYVCLLQAIATDGLDVPLGSLPLEVQRLPERAGTVQASSTGTDDGEKALLHALFEAHADATPDAPALVFQGGTWTYGEVEARANRLAKFLRRQGIAPESRVGLCFESEPARVVSVLATLKAGGAYVPLDPGYPDERLARMVEDVRPTLILTQENLRTRVSPFVRTVVCVDAEWARIETFDASREEVPLAPESLAYVLFTSGSTGRPKGVMNTHRALCNLVRWSAEEYGLGREDAVLARMSFSFDVSVWEMFAALGLGGRLVLPPRGGTQDQPALAALIREQSVTTMASVPGMLETFLDEPAARAAVPGLRRLIIGGEALSAKLVERVRRYSQAAVHVQYGVTEAAVVSTGHTGGSGQRRAQLPIGRAIRNATARVLDASLGPVPVGAVGELYLGGAPLARGYFENPAATAERFVPDPYAETPGARMYRTGDLARMLPDGTLEHLGRVDTQVKLRGFRIELGEVEVALSSVPGIQQAVAAVKEDAGGVRRLVAYVQARQDVSLTEEGLRKHLEGLLPSHMLPSRIVFLHELPTTASGKIQRSALPPPEWSSGPSHASDPPVGERETRVAELWKEVLGAPMVGRRDDFFALGGHSLLAMQLLAKLRERTGLSASVRTLFSFPVLADFVAQLVERAEDEASGADTQAQPHPDEPLDGPASAMQEFRFGLEQAEPGRLDNVLLLAVRLGGFEPASLRESLKRGLRTHPALRTVLRWDGQRLSQAILPSFEERLSFLAESPPPAGTIAEGDFVRRALRSLAEPPFGLAAGETLRMAVAGSPGGPAVLLVAAHHLAVDAPSLLLFLTELLDEAASVHEGGGSVAAARSGSYVAFARQQRELLRDRRHEEGRDYWRRVVSGASTPRLPALQVPPSEPLTMTSLTFRLDPEAAAAMRAFCTEARVTPYIALLSVFYVALHRWSGDEDISIASFIDRRPEAGFEGVLGDFSGMVVQRARLSPTLTYRALVRNVREVVLASFQHQATPLEGLFPVAQPAEALRLYRFADATFHVRTDEMPSGGRPPRPALDLVDVDLGVAKGRLTVDFDETPDGWRGVFGYRSDVFGEGEGQQALNFFTALVRNAFGSPDAALLALIEAACC